MVPRSLIETISSLYSLPDVAMRVNELLNSDEATNEQLEQLIVYDPALTAQLLKLVNSAHYGFASSIDTVSRAIAIVGREALRNLVMATAVTSTFKDIPEDLVDMETFWFHSITCGSLARLLAKECNHKDRERFFIAGLLHSIGKLIMFSQFPEQSAEVLSVKDQGENAMVEAEQRVFGFNYAELGAELLKEWQLPPNIWQLVAHQLQPLRVNDNSQDVAILHVATKITACIEPCAIRTYSFNDVDPGYSPEAWQRLGLSEALIQPLVCEASDQSAEILSIIRPGATLVFVNVKPDQRIAESSNKRDNLKAVRRTLN